MKEFNNLKNAEDQITLQSSTLAEVVGLAYVALLYADFTCHVDTAIVELSVFKVNNRFIENAIVAVTISFRGLKEDYMVHGLKLMSEMHMLFGGRRMNLLDSLCENYHYRHPFARKSRAPRFAKSSPRPKVCSCKKGK